MIRFDKVLQAWGTPGFEAILKQAIAQLGIDRLPLQQGLATGNYVADAPLAVAIHSVVEMDHALRVQAGIFYQGVIGGCSCADDPTPASDINEYCEVQLDIDKMSAAVAISLLAE